MNILDLQGACLWKLRNFKFSENMTAFTEVVEVLYGSDNVQEVRDVVVCAAHKSETGIAHCSDPEVRATFKEVLESFPEFSSDCVLRCQKIDGALCTWTVKPANISECPNGDFHACGGICGDIDITTIECGCGASRPEECNRCKGTSLTPLGYRRCQKCDGKGTLGRPDADHVCYWKLYILETFGPYQRASDKAIGTRGRAGYASKNLAYSCNNEEFCTHQMAGHCEHFTFHLWSVVQILKLVN